MRWRGRTVEPCRCWLAFLALEAVSGLEYASDFMWNETPYPAGWCEHIFPLVWREAWRVFVFRVTFGRMAGVAPGER